MLKNISYYLVLLFLISLPFDRFYSEVVLISLIAHTLFLATKEDLAKMGDKRVLALQAMYAVTLVATIYSPYKDTAFFFWFQQLPLLFFPWACAVLSPMLAARRDKLMDGFTISCVAVLLYLFGDAAKTLLYYHLPAATLFTGQFTNQQFSAPLDLHATYMSLYAGLCLLYCIFKLSSGAKRKALYGGAALVLLAGLVQLSSKSALVAVAFSLVLVFPVYMTSGRRRAVVLGASVFAAVTLGAVLMLGPFFHKRMIEDLRKDLSMRQAAPVEQASRMGRWEAAWTLIRAAPVAGYGAGAEKPLLKDVYFQRGMYRSYLLELDTHNQFLSWWLTRGIAGLGVYLCLLGWAFYRSYTARDVLWTGFLALATAVSLGENVLDVQHGLFFVSFFLSFFFFAQKQTNPNLVNNG